MAASLVITPSFVLLGTYEALTEGNCVKWAARLLAKNVKKRILVPAGVFRQTKKLGPFLFLRVTATHAFRQKPRAAGFVRKVEREIDEGEKKKEHDLPVQSSAAATNRASTTPGRRSSSRFVGRVRRETLRVVNALVVEAPHVVVDEISEVDGVHVLA